MHQGRTDPITELTAVRTSPHWLSDRDATLEGETTKTHAADFAPITVTPTPEPVVLPLF
jgi:hypothetical protein